MKLYMIELNVTSLAVTREWLSTSLGFKEVRFDEAGRFALCESGGQRLAIKEQAPASTGVTVAIEVADLDLALTRFPPTTEIVEVPDERYRRATLTSPDGWKVTLFEWVNSPTTN